MNFLLDQIEIFRFNVPTFIFNKFNLYNLLLYNRQMKHVTDNIYTNNLLLICNTYKVAQLKINTQIFSDTVIYIKKR